MTICIRAVTPDDAPQLARVHVDTWRAAYRAILPTSFLDALSYEAREQRWRERLQQAGPQQFTLVVEDHPESPWDAARGMQSGTGELVGFAGGGPERDGTPGYDGEIYAIYVLPKHWRRGIGRLLTAASAQHLAARGFRAAMLWVLEENQRARAFYEALGGQLIGRKAEAIGETPVIEVAYGWPDLHALLIRESNAA